MGPWCAPRQVENRAYKQVRGRSPHADRDDADRQDEMLHHRIHDRQHGDGAERGKKSLDRMLDDAVHAPQLAVQCAASRGAAVVSWISKGGWLAFDASPCANAVPMVRISSSLIMAH